MRLKVSLAILNGDGAIARVEDDDANEIEVAEGASPEATCLKAAKSLREAAERFELLAQEREPYHIKTHDRINHKKLGATQKLPTAP